MSDEMVNLSSQLEEEKEKSKSLIESMQDMETNLQLLKSEYEAKCDELKKHANIENLKIEKVYETNIESGDEIHDRRSITINYEIHEQLQCEESKFSTENQELVSL